MLVPLARVLILSCRLRDSAARHACTTQREKPKKFWGKSGQPCGERQGITCSDCGSGGSITGSQPTLLATYHVPFRGEPAGFLKGYMSDNLKIRVLCLTCVHVRLHTHTHTHTHISFFLSLSFTHTHTRSHRQARTHSRVAS